MSRFSTQAGFTAVELIVTIIFLAVAGGVFFVQKQQIESGARDDARKTAINAMHYSLEEVYFPIAKAYPEKLTAEAFKGVDPALLNDQNGIMAGDQASEYRYEPRDCNEGNCKSYTLRAELENEADFVKDSRNN